MYYFLAYCLSGLTVITTLVYLLWQVNNYSWWKRAVINATSISYPGGPLPDVAIIIPARNEAANLAGLLSDVLEQTALTSRDEIFLVDDHSTDETAMIAQSFGPSVRYLRLADFLADQPVVAHKKAAITYGVNVSTAPYIITTDADCRWGADVLLNIKRSAANGNNFISGPVLIDPAENLCAGFQALDLAGYMMLTAASIQRGRPLLANGAHLSFSRSLFAELNGYQGIDHLSSGDDVLLLQKAVQEPKARIGFLMHEPAAVTTLAAPSWYTFWQQRVRWAGKTGSYTSPELKSVQALAFLQSLLLLLLTVSGVFYGPACWVALLCWMSKAVLEYRMLRHVSQHFGHPEWMLYYPFALVFQPVYLVCIGTTSFLKPRVNWKGRPSVPG